MASFANDIRLFTKRSVHLQIDVKSWKGGACNGLLRVHLIEGASGVNKRVNAFANHINDFRKYIRVLKNDIPA